MKPKTVPEALRAGADYIEKNGWMNLTHGFYENTSSKCSCAVTSITAVLYDPDLRMRTLELFASAIDAGWPNDVWYPEKPGMFVGHWNDEQLNGATVIAKMREVAASVERLAT